MTEGSGVVGMLQGASLVSQQAFCGMLRGLSSESWIPEYAKNRKVRINTMQ